jgi:hypothetical protein
MTVSLIEFVPQVIAALHHNAAKYPRKECRVLSFCGGDHTRWACVFNPGAVGLGAFGLLVLLDGSTLTAAFAQGATVSQSGGAKTVDCGGGDAVLNGSGNSVNFRDTCRTLTVNGSGNAIKIELQSAGTITLNGTGNNVSYAPAGGTADAAVTDHGQGNTVTRFAASPGGTATITGNAAGGGSLSIRVPAANPFRSDRTVLSRRRAPISLEAAR